MTIAPGTSSTKSTGINWPILRYSDILLMYAETENEIGGKPSPEAIKALSTVRERAFPLAAQAEKVTDYLATVSQSKESFFNAIVDERAWEFGGECIRKYDLIRWNLYGQKIAAARNTMTQMGIDCQAGTGTYANYPKEVWWKLGTDGVTLNILGLYKKYTGVPDARYSKVSWLSTLYDPKLAKLNT